jgi:hypothetical protein
MTNLINSFNSTELDSLKVRIPFNQVTVLDEKLQGTKITYLEETGEQLREFKDNALKFKTNGISTRFAIEIMPTDSKGNKKEYLTILINAKLLKQRYFEGITAQNITDVYNDLIAFKVAYFSLESLLGGFCTDMDFKTDTRLPIDDYSELIRFFKANAKSQEAYRDFNRKTNKGIQFSKRETKSFKTKPFWKLYHKETELFYHSEEFKKQYLIGQNLKDLIRFEFTIKNNQHLKSLKINSNTLNSILSLTDDVKKGILKSTLQVHLETYIRQMKKREGMQPTDELLHNLLILAMEKGMSFEAVSFFALSSFSDRVAKARKKSQLNKIYREYIQGSKKDISTKNIQGVLELIGLFDPN